jgi:glyoxylase-like metal-dependent hydrolase (beta-lactamase superfamily II)
VFALHVTGHTPGSAAFAVRTTDGPVRLVGDASHTVWGWDHDAEPGTFSLDQPQSAESLAHLRAPAKAVPNVAVHVGHQSHDEPRVAARLQSMAARNGGLR